MLRKIISILFLFLLTVNSAVILFYYWSQLQINKLEIREYIESGKDLGSGIVSSFSTADSNFILVGDNEIRCNGKMYDIFKFEIINGDTVYSAISDMNEDVLIAFIGQLAKHISNNGNTAQKGMNFEIIQYVSLIGNFITDKKIYCYTTEKLFTHSTFCFYQSPYLGILFPPPRQSAA